MPPLLAPFHTWPLNGMSRSSLGRPWLSPMSRVSCSSSVVGRRFFVASCGCDPPPRMVTTQAGAAILLERAGEPLRREVRLGPAARASSRAWRLPVSGRQRPGALRRQGQGPAATARRLPQRVATQGPPEDAHAGAPGGVAGGSTAGERDAGAAARESAHPHPAAALQRRWRLRVPLPSLGRGSPRWTGAAGVHVDAGGVGLPPRSLARLLPLACAGASGLRSARRAVRPARPLGADLAASRRAAETWGAARGLPPRAT